MRSFVFAFGILSASGAALVIACGSDSGSEFDDGKGNLDAGPGGEGGNGFGTSDGGDDGAAAQPDTDVEAVVTSDNAFSFGYGSKTSLATYIRGEGSDGPAIFDCPVGFGPKAFLVPAASAPQSAYLYIVAWADESTTQGTLAQFKRVGGTGTIYSGSGEWETCATGKPFSTNGNGPDQNEVNSFIEQCNLGATGATYSKGWVNTAGAITAGAKGKLAFGEANDNAGGAFPIVCQKDADGGQGIDAVAKWMWFDPQTSTDSPFVGNTDNRTKTFLIFRLPASALPPAPVK